MMRKEAWEVAFVNIMNLIEQYLELQGCLAAKLRSGHLNVSTGRYCMGSERISSLQLPVRMQATLRVTAEEDGSLKASSFDPSWCMERPSKRNKNTHSEQSDQQTRFRTQTGSSQVPCNQIQAVHLGAALNNLSLHEAPARSSVLHELAAKYDCLDDRDALSDAGVEEDEVDAAHSATSPLHWFGALVAPSLREAQLDFRDSITLALQAASVKQQLLRQLGEYEGMVLHGEAAAISPSL